MRVTFTSPDLRSYVAQLRATDPETLQAISAEALRAAMPEYLTSLRRHLRRHVSNVPGRRRRLKGTGRARIWIRRKRAPNALLKVYTRVESREDPKQPPAGTRLLFLEGTLGRRTKAGKWTGRVRPRRIIEQVSDEASGRADAEFNATYNTLLQAALTFRGRRPR